MIAVAKSLPGLETGVAPASRRDGATTPPFADTFQQVSADQAGRESQIVTQRVARAERASSGGTKDAVSSSVDSPEQAVGTNAGIVSAVKTDGKALTAAVEADNSGEERVSGAVVADALEEQGGASTHADVNAVHSKATFAAGGGEASVVVASNQLNKLGVSTPVVVPESNSASEEVAFGASSTLRQGVEKDLSGAGGAEQSAAVSLLAGRGTAQTDQKTPVSAPGVTASKASATAVATVVQNVSKDSSEGLKAVLPAAAGNEGLVAGVNLSGQAASGVETATESWAPIQRGAGSVAPVEGLPVRVAFGSLQVSVPVQVTKSAAGSTAANGSNGGVRRQESNGGAGASATGQDAPVTGTQIAGSDQAAMIVSQLQVNQTADVVPQGRVTESSRSSSPVPVGATPVASQVQVPEIVTSASVASGMTSSKRGQGRKSVTVGSDEVATPVATVMTKGAPPDAMPAPLVNVPVVAQTVSMGDAAAISTSFKADPISNVITARTSSPDAASPVNDRAAHGGNSSAEAMTAAPGSALNTKAGAVGLVPSEAAAATVESAETTVSGSGVTADAAVAANNSPSDAVPLSPEVIVAAATSMVKNGQQRGTISAAIPATKERKAAVEELKPADAAASSVPTESAHGVPAAHPSFIASAAAKADSGDHQAIALSGGQTAVVQVASVGAAAQAWVSAAVASTPVPALHSASSLASVDVSTSTTTVTSQTSMLGENALSPMAHTTLSATPTVLEVGVPGGTQGWLKIRAEIGEGGVVQASLSAATHAGQDALHRDLPALSAFLESEHVPVNLQVAHGVSGSVLNAAAMGKDGGFDLGSSLGQSLSQNANSSTGSGHGEAGTGTVAGGNSNGQNGSQQREASGRGSDSGSNAVPTGTAVGAADSDWTAPVGYGSGAVVNGGSWLNVIA